MKQYRMLIQSVLIVVLGYMFLLLPHIVLAQEGSEGRSVDQEFVTLPEPGAALLGLTALLSLGALKRLRTR